MKEEGTAPDGTEIHVTRNHGKPTRAQELAKALADARKAKTAGKAGKKSPAEATHAIVAPAPAASTSNVEKLAKEGLKPVAEAPAAHPGRGERKVPPATEDGNAPLDAERMETTENTEKKTRGPKPHAPVMTMATGSMRSAGPQAREARTSSVGSTPSVAAEAGQAGPKPSAISATSAAGPSGAPKRKSMQVRFTGMKPLHVVEAALFAAGKPITVEEIAEQTGLPPDKVKEGIKDLQAAYSERDTILEVGKAGTKWAMQVRSQAAEPAAKFAPMEIAPKLLKTLALIAFHQPMKQSQLVDMMGTKVYDHIPELVSRGLVRAREEGVTKILQTTPLFPEYFGLDASDPDEIRALMGRLVGIVAPPKPKAETVYEDPQPQQAEVAADEAPGPAPETLPPPTST
ncbi:MAG TPA: SMC-Scp complex subunit ScpB [Candidatus Thermoplasmatota archaeon]|nr:SMC-Scp complex subunit ScpB [Candidatus Thermoplasmatota archaeon]